MTKKIKAAQQKLKEQEAKMLLAQNRVGELQSQYIEKIETDPEFSLLPDPTGKYKMGIAQKEFIRHYVNFKSVGTAAELAGISADEAKEYFVSYYTQQEIRRINRALYQRQFANKLISLDEIGGYLSSLLTDENVPIADQLKTTDKLRVVDMLLKINDIKSASMIDPSELNKTDIAIQIKKLSVTTIQQLLTQQNNINEKNSAISKLDDGNLTIEEKAYLQTLPVNELLQLIEDTNKKENKNEQTSI